MGHRVAYAAVEQFKMKISSKICTNCDSWIGLTKTNRQNANNTGKTSIPSSTQRHPSKYDKT